MSLGPWGMNGFSHYLLRTSARRGVKPDRKFSPCGGLRPVTAFSTTPEASHEKPSPSQVRRPAGRPARTRCLQRNGTLAGPGRLARAQAGELAGAGSDGARTAEFPGAVRAALRPRRIDARG